jgi:hypothetical protein
MEWVGALRVSVAIDGLVMIMALCTELGRHRKGFFTPGANFQRDYVNSIREEKISEAGNLKMPETLSTKSKPEWHMHF